MADIDHSALSAADVAMFSQIGVPADLLQRGRIARVTDDEARERCGFSGSGNYGGLLFPYIDPRTQRVPTHRLRRDHPDMRDGKPEGKYRAPFGDSRHLYFAPGADEFIDDARVQVVLVEAEKSALATTAASIRTGRRLVAIASAGCWGWRGVIGKTIDAHGARVDEKGPLPDLNLVTWTDRDVVIVFDSNVANNTRVRAAERALAAELRRRGARVRLGRIPLEEGINGPDDFIGKHGDREFFALVEAAQLPDDITIDGRLVIDAGDQNLPRVAARVLEAIQQGNDPPILLRTSAGPCRVERNDKGQPMLRPLTPDVLTHHVARWAEFRRTRLKEGAPVRVDALPPKAIVCDLLAHPALPLPILDRMIEAPAFTSAGRLCQTPGYNAGLYYAPAQGFVVPTIADRPTREAVRAARDLLTVELTDDFPFVGPSEQAHAMALLLLPFARDLIQGNTPLHLIEKPAPGTGATLLVATLMWPAIGREVAPMTEGRDEDEWRKRITAQLAAGATATLIDNLRGRLDSAAVSSVLTSSTWTDRLLGASSMVSLPNRTVWIATGNNPALSNEITRRTVRIRLDAQVDRPHLRPQSAYRHPDLRQWLHATRPQLVAAALTLIQAWLAAGRPLGRRSMGNFEAWAAVMGGILAHADIPGFLDNLDEFYDGSDDETAQWNTFVHAWAARHGECVVGVSDLFDLIGNDIPIDLGDKTELSRKIRLGKLLGKKRDRVFAGYRILAAGEAQRASLWKLAKLPETGGGK